MSCGCGTQRPQNPVVDTSCAICALFTKSCAYTKNGPRPYTPRWCDVSPDGRVRWLRVWWYGMPYPLRVALWWKYRDRWTWSKVRQLPGCGCIAPLKDWWTRQKALVSVH